MKQMSLAHNSGTVVERIKAAAAPPSKRPHRKGRSATTFSCAARPDFLKELHKDGPSTAPRNAILALADETLL